VGKPSIVTFNTILSAACRSSDAEAKGAAIERWFRRCEASGSSPRHGWEMGMGQNLLLPYLEESTSINQLF